MHDLSMREMELAEKARKSMGVLHQRLQEAVVEGIKNKAEAAEYIRLAEIRNLAEMEIRRGAEAEDQLMDVLNHIQKLKCTKELFDTKVKVDMIAMFKDAVHMQAEMAQDTATKGLPPDDSSAALQLLRQLQAGYFKEQGECSTSLSAVTVTEGSAQAIPPPRTKIALLEEILGLQGSLQSLPDPSTEAEAKRVQQLLVQLNWLPNLDLGSPSFTGGEAVGGSDPQPGLSVPISAPSTSLSIREQVINQDVAMPLSKRMRTQAARRSFRSLHDLAEAP